MKTEIIMAGFGGTRRTSYGKDTAIRHARRKEVTGCPLTAPKQRGGTANVIAIISDERISSPILSKYDGHSLISLHDKFMPKQNQVNAHLALHRQLPTRDDTSKSTE